MDHMLFSAAAPFLALFVCEFAYHRGAADDAGAGVTDDAGAGGTHQAGGSAKDAGSGAKDPGSGTRSSWEGERLLLSAVPANWFFWFLMCLFFTNLFPVMTAGTAVFFLVALIAGLANYFVILFRSTPVTPADLLSLRTGVAVAGAYSFSLPFRGIISCLAAAAGIAGTAVLETRGLLGFAADSASGRTADSAAGAGFLTAGCGHYLLSAAALVVFLLVFFCVDLRKALKIRRRPWRQVADCRRYGFLPFFLCGLQDLRIRAPRGYESGKAAELLKQAGAFGGRGLTESMLPPVVITIMNESFSDLSVLGPFKCAGEHLKFYRSLKTDPGMIEYGWDYVSTRGGGTARTEFEYLTGGSMQFVPGSIPFIQYGFEGVPAAAHDFKRAGYTTVAMHPEDPKNWSRDRVFREMGFDRFLSREDFPDAKPMVFGHTDDRSDYERLLQEVRSHEKPLFLFNVTMQNHGGYALKAFTDAGKTPVTIDGDLSVFTDAQAFETLMKASDDALAFLIGELRREKRPVLLTFFGDHQPALDERFEKGLIRKSLEKEGGRIVPEHEIGERYFQVPYFIWTNSPDLKKQISVRAEKEAAGGIIRRNDVISPNYLGIMTEYYAGLELTDFGSFLYMLRGKLPAMNESGFLGDDWMWHEYGSFDAAGYEKLLGVYEELQYHVLFRKGAKGSLS